VPNTIIAKRTRKVSFTLDKVVPWGRSFDEYVAMFALSEVELTGRLLGCGDGPASFNVGLSCRGGRIVSVDPLYAFAENEIQRRIDATYPEVMDQLRRNQQQFVWTSFKSPEELGLLRRTAMEEFLADYPTGVAQQRYVEGGLPRLPFANRSFDLAVCSHLLFLYSEQFPAEFHLDSIRELCRVAGEVRIFPLFELGARQSRHLPVVSSQLQALGYNVRVVRVAYEFQKGANKMMCVRSG